MRGWWLVCLAACETPSGGTTPDSGLVDARIDAVAADAAEGDANRLDAASDSTTPDAAPPDAAPPDAGLPDAALPDAAPPEPGSLPRFAFPIHPTDRALIQPAPIFGIDHDPVDGPDAVCTNYAGRSFPLCYDGHDGTDFVLRGGFATMDRGSARVVAAAGGVVVEAEDGHYDRCHASAASADVSCDGHPVIANYVRLLHFDGWTTRYLHLKNGSVVVQVGDRVTCGAELGRVGSSGRSSFPHLHFAVADPGGQRWDPYAGPFSQPETLWGAQETPDGLPGDLCDPSWGAVPESL